MNQRPSSGAPQDLHQPGISKLVRGAALLVVAAAAVVPAGAQNDTLAARAMRLHRDAIVVDTHIDTTERLNPGWRFEERHLAPASGAAGASSVDLPRMREGGLDAAFFSVWIPGTITGPKAVSLAKEEFDKIKVLVSGHPKDLTLCTTADEVRAAHRADKVAVLIGVEGGHMINNDLEVLREYRGMGASYLTLTHSVNVGWADSSGDKPDAGGLTPFGRSVVRELNRLGMLVDVSHVSDKTFWDVLEVSQAPVIASHSSCRALCGHPRNMTDDMIKALAAKGGVIQINFMDGFIDDGLFRAEEALAAKYPGAENENRRWKEARAAFAQMTPPNTVSWERILDHIDHAVKLVGADHVGLGSDFDGATMPRGMEDCSQLPKITQGLLARGYKESAIRQILGENTLRVLDQADRIAHKITTH
jgi:membrane dipeptidase